MKKRKMFDVLNESYTKNAIQNYYTKKNDQSITILKSSMVVMQLFVQAYNSLSYSLR